MVSSLVDGPFESGTENPCIWRSSRNVRMYRHRMASRRITVALRVHLLERLVIVLSFQRLVIPEPRSLRDDLRLVNIILNMLLA